MNKLPLLLLSLLLGVCGVVRAQSFDLTTGRVPVASLEGLWRFHTGDDPAWADPNFDDSKWSLLRSDRGWGSQGYKGYEGIAWYRFQVTVPANLEHVSLYLRQLRTSYEVYADGGLLGTFGKMPPKATKYDGGIGYFVYALPGGKHPVHTTQIALRVWSTSRFNDDGGPWSGGGLVGETSLIEHRDALERVDRFWSLVPDETLGLLETLAGLGAFTLFLLRRRESEYLWFSLMMLLTAASEWCVVSVQVQVWNHNRWVDIFFILSGTASLATVAFYQQLLQPKRRWLLKLAAASIVLQIIVNFLPGPTLTAVHFFLFKTLFDLTINACILTAMFNRAEKNSIDARLLLAPVILTTSSFLLYDVGAVASALGWPNAIRYFTLFQSPFKIYASGVADAVFLLSVFAILILRFTRTRSQEERFESEVQAAREIQQYLIPAHMPLTPGLTIETEYRPAREVGGDFFQVLPHAEDGSVLLVLGDVAGKGLHAGMLATLIVGAVRTAAKFTIEPERILALLNERLQGRGLVTCLALLIERDGNVTLANAGHLPPYLNEREMPMEGALPLGALPGIEFSGMHFQLAEGDSLMLMSDGVAEAQDARGQLFGFERIGAMLSEGATAASLAIAAQNFGQEDDITVLTVARLVPVMIA